jgi:uncharacterized membrane protein
MLTTSGDMWSGATWYVIAACVILLVVVAILYLTIGRKQQQIEAGRPWREVLDGLPVAVVGKYFHMRARVTSKEFIATLMSLQNDGLLTVGSSEAIIEQEKADGLVEPVGAEALKIFEIFADADGVMLLSSVCDTVRVSKVRDRLDTAYSRWKDVVDRVAKDVEPAISDKDKMKFILKYLSYALILLALVVFSTLGLIAATALLIAGLAILGISSIIKKELSQVENAAKELYEWLTGQDSEELLPQDVGSWNQLLIYARAFGIEKEIFERLKAEAPQIVEDANLLSLNFWARFEATAFNVSGR